MNETSDPQFFDPPPVPSSIGVPLPVPMSLGQILDRIYRLMRAHLGLFFGIAAVPAATVFVTIAGMMSFLIPKVAPQLAGKTPGVGAVAGGLPPWFPATILVSYPVILLVYALYVPAASFAATQADLGVNVGFRQAYGVAWNNFGRYLLLMILSVLGMVLPILVLGVLTAGGALLLARISSSPAGLFFLIPLLVLLYIAVLVYSVVIVLRIVLAFPASVEEGLTAWAAIWRSVRLTRNAQGRVLLVLLVVYAVSYAVTLVGIAALFALGALGAVATIAAHIAVGSPAFIFLVCLAILGYLAVLVAFTMFSYAALTTALAVLYHDQRLRRDSLTAAAPLA